jgi:hypothetical protein
MISRLAPYAPTGRPPPMILPTKSRHHLVEDEKRSRPGRKLAHLSQVPVGGNDAAHVADDGLYDDSGDIFVLLKDLFERRRVVKGNGQSVGRELARHARTVRQTERGDARAGFD